jgi:hypothetical protein
VTHTIRKNQESLVLGSARIRGPKRNIVAVIVTLPGQAGKTFFSIDICDESARLRRWPTVIAAYGGFALAKSADIELVVNFDHLRPGRATERSSRLPG